MYLYILYYVPILFRAEIWNEKHVDDLPVLSVKYSSDSEGAVAVDGSSAAGADGIFTNN